jgi:hypothetical protein
MLFSFRLFFFFAFEGIYIKETFKQQMFLKVSIGSSNMEGRNF